MKTSTFLAATGAVLALANPLDKRVMETEVVVEYYTVTVTGNPPAPTPTNIKVRPNPEPVQEQSTPATTAQPVVFVTVTPEPEPKPTTTVEKPAPKPSPVNNVPAQADDSFQSTALYHHNIHRFNHSSPEVTWNSEIAGYAATTAKTCKFAHDM